MPVGGAPRRRERPAGSLAELVKATKTPGLVEPVVREHLLKLHHTGADDRPADVIHPSEMAKAAWCPRATYLRIAMAREGKTFIGDANRFQLENIFAEGDRIHEKWQTWLGDAGVLWGRWICLVCTADFLDLSPKTCPNCDAGVLKFLEVPLRSSDEFLIRGHADGEIRNEHRIGLLEIKSIGDGTVRVELPQKFKQYTRKAEDHTCFDLKGLFRDIHRPFPSHLRQGWLYLWLREQSYPDEPPVDQMAFLYEGKATQVTREFLIRRDDAMIAPLLEMAQDIVYGLEQGKAPSCITGRRSRCAECSVYETGAGSGTAQADTEPGDAARGDDRPRRSRTRTPRDRAAGEATGRGARAGSRVLASDERRGADHPDGSVHGLGGLLADAAGVVRSRREHGEDTSRKSSRHRTGNRQPDRQA